jgi:hypothetical protein
MRWINVAVSGALDTLLWPFRPLPAAVGLTALALGVSIAILLVVRATSDQAALALVKRRIYAALFELRLFNDDVRAMARAVWRIVRANVDYLRLAAVPALCLTAPLVLLLTHLQFYYGYDGLPVGGSAVVTVRVGAAVAPRGSGVPDIAIEVPAGLRVETLFVWIPSEREASWRIGTERAGDYEIVFRLGQNTVTKRVRVSDEPGWRSPDRRRMGFWNALIAPAEPPLDPDAWFDSIAVTYPERRVTVLGMHTHWSVVLLAAVIGFTVVLRGRFGVVL